MNVIWGKGFAWMLLVALSCAGAGGCCHGETRKFDSITFTLADSLRDSANNFSTVHVHLVGVNSSELPGWEKQNATEYFHSDAASHPSTGTVALELDTAHPSQTISRNDPNPDNRKAAQRLWEEAEKRKASTLVVLCDYPRGPNDITLLRVPITCDRWANGQKELRFNVTSAGLQLLTPPLPPKD